ncbi:sigma-70 family RNA polymerase sigma factor [Sphingomonas sp. PWP1-2]|uniref:sigma-70 family RNA polymerase sigma factor n=1 Tax=Sphingomonas sp. PWP1-2 TaxID=2804558 RepID=UPI003CF8B4D3
MARTHLAEALIRTGEQDRQAFQDVYQLTSAKLFGICLRVCGERTAAEDILHEVYMTIWKRAGAWEPGRSSPITWLAVIARNRAIDWRRAQRIRRAAPLEDGLGVVDPADDPELIAGSRRENCRVLRCLDALDQRERDAIRSAFLEGLTYNELAEQHGVPVGTMKSWVRRGLAKLRANVERDRDSNTVLRDPECRPARSIVINQ